MSQLKDYLSIDEITHQLKKANAFEIHLLLGTLGYQELDDDDHWQPTQTGHQKGCLLMYTESQNESPTMQWYWHKNILSDLKSELLELTI